MPIKGAMNGEAFLAYIEQCLVPTLKRRNIVMVERRPPSDSLTAIGHHLSLTAIAHETHSLVRKIQPSDASNFYRWGVVLSLEGPMWWPARKALARMGAVAS
jgi:hypothetical protein